MAFVRIIRPAFVRTVTVSTRIRALVCPFVTKTAKTAFASRQAYAAASTVMCVAVQSARVYVRRKFNKILSHSYNVISRLFTVAAAFMANA